MKILQEEFINTFIIEIVWLEKHFPPFDNTLQWIILYNFTFTYTLYISIEKYFRSFQPQFSGVYVLKLYYYTLNFYLLYHNSNLCLLFFNASICSANCVYVHIDKIIFFPFTFKNLDWAYNKRCAEFQKQYMFLFFLKNNSKFL